MVIVGLSIN